MSPPEWQSVDCERRNGCPAPQFIGLSRFRFFLPELRDASIAAVAPPRALQPDAAIRNFHMRGFLKGAAMALLLAGTALAAAGAANAAGAVFGTPDRELDHAVGAISISFDDVALGYRDGYWDKNNSWHKWNNRGDYQRYRNRRDGNYQDWNYDRYPDHGWQRR
jgi:hypothetical protein